MLRRLASVLGLAICLHLLVGSATQARTCAVSDSWISTSRENSKAVEAKVSTITPGPESANVVPDFNLTGFLANALLVTREPALIQLHMDAVTHQKWQCYGLADVAPFVCSRSLPIQV